jgi:putative membrane protein
MEQQQTEKKQGGPTDHLANERTFLAWIRTSIAIMAFGFVVVKFALFVKQITLIMGEKNDGLVLPNRGYSEVLGIILVVIGVLMAFFSYIRYKNIERQLLTNTYSSSSKISVLFTFAIILVGLLLIVYLISSI